MNQDFIELYNSKNYDRQLRKNEERLKRYPGKCSIHKSAADLYYFGAWFLRPRY